VKWFFARTVDKEANAKTAGASVFARTAEEKANAKTAGAAAFARTAEEEPNAKTAVAAVFARTAEEEALAKTASGFCYGFSLWRKAATQRKSWDRSPAQRRATTCFDKISLRRSLREYGP
jgi:hypothetical protein